MKKLKKFVLNSPQRLSPEEMVNIHGADITAVDVANCKEEGQTCIFEYSNATGALLLGKCMRETTANGSTVIMNWTCKR